jgi:hypothetical protein
MEQIMSKFFFCIAIGQADFMPDDQRYHAVETETEFRDIVKNACDQWERDLPEADETQGDEYYVHEFHMPREGEGNYSQRLRIAASTDWSLDVIGMTESEYLREFEGEG